jgi:hypothetical protein
VEINNSDCFPLNVHVFLNTFIAVLQNILTLLFIYDIQVVVVVVVVVVVAAAAAVMQM